MRSVGPTVFSVTSGIGTPARLASSKKMYCSSAVRPLPAVLLRPADTEPTVGTHLLHDLAVRLATRLTLGEVGAALRGHQAGEVLPQLLLERSLLWCEIDQHSPGL